MNRNGSPSDGRNKRSSASAGLKESPSKRRPMQRSFEDLLRAFEELTRITNVPIDRDIEVPLFKVYQYVKAPQSPSKLAARKLDMGADDKQSASTSNLSASEIAKLKLTDSKLDEGASSEQTSDSSDDEDLNLCLQASYLEDLKRVWTFEYISIIKAKQNDSDYPAELRNVIDELLCLFRQLIYLELFVGYNVVHSHSLLSQSRQVQLCIVAMENLKLMQNHAFDRSEFDPEQMAACTNHEFTVKIGKLWDIEEVNMHAAIEVTKFFIIKYYEDPKTLKSSHYDKFTEMANEVRDEFTFVRGILTSLSGRQLSKEKSDLLTYFNAIRTQIERYFTNVIHNAESVYTVLNR